MKLFLGSRFIYLLIITACLFPSFANAAIMIRFVDVIIIKNTVAEDGLFDFSVYDTRYPYIMDSFQIQTQNNIGVYDTSLLLLFFSGSLSYDIYENPSGSWALQNLDCASDNPNNTFQKLNGAARRGVLVFPLI